jgi:hypothetical protein
MRRREILLAVPFLIWGCAKDPDYGTYTPDPGTGGVPGVVGPGIGPTGLHVVQNHIEDSEGKTVVLRGVNRSGPEYQCAKGAGFFDGPATEASVAVITTWKANTVRVPLNESCWLGINGSPPANSGPLYKTAIVNYVALLHKYGLIPILELHWVGPGTTLAARQQPMPDADHAIDFWTDVATTFLSDTGVILEPYNEPYPDSNRDTPAAWDCWLNGCTANLAIPAGGVPGTYVATGLQALVSAIRSTGASHVILLGGIQFSNNLSQFLTHMPTDPMGNIGAAWHVYNFNACSTPACWDGDPAAVAAVVPLVATEFGQRDCMGTFVTPFMQWLDAHSSGYLAWAWNAYGTCAPYVSRTVPGQPWSLITNYTTGTPNGGFAQAVYDRFTAP